MLTINARQARVLAIAWLTFISILFFLPGSALPKTSWLDAIYFDKWVHFGFFALLVFLWRFSLPAGAKYHWLVLLAALFYGLMVEVIQQFFVANRSFDSGDVAADALGAAAGIWLWTWYKKNRPL